MEQRVIYPEMNLSAEQIQYRILETAMRIFSEKGFARASTRIIAAQSGVNEMTLLRHFNSKYRLLLEAVDTLYTAPHITRQVVTSDDYCADLRHLAQVMTETLDHRRATLRLILGEAELQPELADSVLSVPPVLVGIVRDLLRHHLEAGRNTISSSEAAAQVFVHQCFALGLSSLGAPVRASVLNTFVDLFVQGTQPC